LSQTATEEKTSEKEFIVPPKEQRCTYKRSNRDTDLIDVNSA